MRNSYGVVTVIAAQIRTFRIGYGFVRSTNFFRYSSAGSLIRFCLVLSLPRHGLQTYDILSSLHYLIHTLMCTRKLLHQIGKQPASVVGQNLVSKRNLRIPSCYFSLSFVIRRNDFFLRCLLVRPHVLLGLMSLSGRLAIFCN